MTRAIVFLLAAALAGTVAAAETGADMEKGRRMFLKGTTPACAVCHTLQDAGAAGTIGPDLDELKPSAERVAKAIREGLGVMPAFKNLSAEEVRTLSGYVENATR